MPLLFIYFQNAFDLRIKHRIFPAKPLADVLMYSALADAEMSGSRPYRSLAFDDVSSEHDSSLIRSHFQFITPKQVLQIYIPENGEIIPETNAIDTLKKFMYKCGF